MPALTDMRRALAGLASIAMLALAGCASQPTARLNQQQLYSLDNWTAEGKLGLRVNGRANSASFSWRNSGPNYLVNLHGPFGQGAVSLRKENGWVTLQSEEHNDTARSPEQLMEEALGWSLPISELVYWIKGLPSPESSVRNAEKNEAGKLETLEQRGWRIRYADYQMENGALLPHKIIANREDIRLVLAIKRWRIEL